MSTPKPLYRGALHQAAFFLALVGTGLLARLARPGIQSSSAAIFGGSLVVLFGTSALYHRVRWGHGALRWMQRLDHSAIFASIAGGFTPLFALVPSEGGGHGALAAMWIGAAAGAVASFGWPHARPWVRTSQCVALGSLGVCLAVPRAASVGVTTIALLVATGVVYAIGGLVYATRRPDPLPRVFGYHEVFHALIVLGSVSLFAHVALVLART
jgi:hemolysin III